MKKSNIFLPILASASLVPIANIVSCSKHHFEINDWWGGSEWLQSEETSVEDGQTWDYSIDMTKWLAGEGTEHPEYYPYFELKLASGSPTTLLKIKSDSLTMSIDGQNVTKDDWQYIDDIGGFRFSKDLIRNKIMNCNKITGSFLIESISGDKISTVINAVWYSPYNGPTL